jgi:hypothetical protein
MPRFTSSMAVIQAASSDTLICVVYLQWYITFLIKSWVPVKRDEWSIWDDPEKCGDGTL